MLALTGGLAACSSDADQADAVPERTQSQSRSKPVARQDFSRRDLLVTAVCTPGNGGGGIVSVDGWSPQNLKKVAHAEFQLPDTVVTKTEEVRPGTAVDDLCSPDGLTDSNDILAVGSLFDQNFTKLAVVIQDPKSMATHVGYVDRSGKLTDLTGQEGFGNTPHEDNAVMAPDGSEVWFTREVDEEERVASRPLAGDHQVVDRQQVESVGESHLFVVGTPATAVLGGGPRISPDGKRLLSGGGVLEIPAGRRVIDEDLVDQATPVSCGEPDAGSAIRWIDNDTVLCGSDLIGQRFSTLDLAPNATPSAPILPGNDHKNFVQVVSPDGKRFLFLSVNENARDHYLSDLEPGSTPKKAEPSGEFSALGVAVFFLDWR
ncbi:hypothetical protein [Flindersiella endophytica]